jgi:hypothetical protein
VELSHARCLAAKYWPPTAVGAYAVRLQAPFSWIYPNSHSKQPPITSAYMESNGMLYDPSFMQLPTFASFRTGVSISASSSLAQGNEACIYSLRIQIFIILTSSRLVMTFFFFFALGV